jgi:cytosine/adenosine deaminase-related metal-dependent hydrolase
VKLLSARWVVPVARPPIDEGAVALSDDGIVLAVGGRAEVRAEFPDAVEERAQGVLVPGLVNAHCHLELAGHAGGVPGGQGLFAWATTLMSARKADTAEQQRAAAATAAAAAVALGTAAIGDVGNSLAAAPGIGGAGLTGVLFHELFGSREIATGDALADAARERAEAAAEWP